MMVLYSKNSDSTESLRKNKRLLKTTQSSLGSATRHFIVRLKRNQSGTLSLVEWLKILGWPNEKSKVL
ncbi:hypothetical protein HCUR_00407 [Holospora curviuscula]|uniref:Uncharacterized protein n=1 Tax=Holospora curviuscula TaxID=1082868 RepID=A0A2S5RA59_9PROT|nr:hypothetical protein HCUR_00407 [Holospora curviuscula]